MRQPAARTSSADLLLAVYSALFFLFLYLPILVVAAAAFNDYRFPSVVHWEGFTLKWFGELLRDERLMRGLANSVIVGLGVVALAIPMGLAAALVLSRLGGRTAGFLYAVLVSPILAPGIILGISTLLFWRQLGVSGGLFTAMLAQTTFVASFAMLLFMARLQRYDHMLDEAAQDLGASGLFVFRTITLPFLAPTIVTAALLGFLQSFENYNTTVFSIGADWTLVTEIGSVMRRGLTPAINALGVIFIVLTLAGAVTWVVLTRRGGPSR